MEQEKKAPPRKRASPAQAVIVRLPLAELYPFPDHPYGIREDQAMLDTLDSVRANGVAMPAIVRPRPEGGYEIVAGHRRKLASERAGFTDMPCIVRNLTDDEAIIQLVQHSLIVSEFILQLQKRKCIIELSSGLIKGIPLVT